MKAFNFKSGDNVKGLYMNMFYYSGVVSETFFGEVKHIKIILDCPIVVFGAERNSIIVSNHADETTTVQA